ncbi:MAG: AAA domain-containing protein [Desulfobacteraceae bacterium]|nr:AAA domain-containing protein [Desulfobacteraceae bacterium]
MTKHDENIPDPKKLEKEIGDFLTKKFGGTVRLASPIMMPQEDTQEVDASPKEKKRIADFNLKPEELVAYLDQYIVKQDDAKAILSTKICTHFNRIRYNETSPEDRDDMVGSIKNNVLMIGPTGVGKTYMVRLIAKKLGVPFVKGDATKFSETGYVGGDVEDLVRDLVREADGDMKRAQYGIIYIDEIDKIASSHNLIGADVSRTGVQRALLKPLEETEVDMKVPHDPISMIQEIENFRKTGKRDRSTINTKNILFIVSGAFSDIIEIIKKRITTQKIGFGAQISLPGAENAILKHIKSEDLISYGFESEFVGRLPVRAVFEPLVEKDLLEILKNPNNPIILGKKRDFAAYGINIKFNDEALAMLAKAAFQENTGARGLVSAVETAMLPFEKTLPSTPVKTFPVTAKVIRKRQAALEKLVRSPDSADNHLTYGQITQHEKDRIVEYINSNKRKLDEKYGFILTGFRSNLIADYYSDHITDIDRSIKKIKGYFEDTKTIELHFLKNFGINLVLEDDAIDHIIEQFARSHTSVDYYYKKLADDFEHGLRLVREKTGQNRFFISKTAILNPEKYIAEMLRNQREI